MTDLASTLRDTLGMFLFLGIELSVLFILISYFVSLLQQYIPDAKIQAILSGKKGWGYVFAAALGAVTPFCSCSTIPMLRGLLKAKAGFGPTMTFLFCSPLLNPIILGLFLATFGTRVTLYYTAIGLIVSVAAGIILDIMNFERFVIPESEATAPSCCGSPEVGDKAVERETDCCSSAPKSPCCTPAPVTACCCSAEPVKEAPVASSCCGSPIPAPSSCCEPKPEPVSCCCSAPAVDADSKPTFRQRSRMAFQEAVGQFKSVALYLLLGVTLGACVYGFVPADFIAEYASGDNLFAIPIAAVIGIPLYVRTEVLIPLSGALAGKGMGLGAIMALIIGGGGASITEVILLKSMFRMPMIIAFLVVILGMAVSAGYIFQFVL